MLCFACAVDAATCAEKAWFLIDFILKSSVVTSFYGLKVFPSLGSTDCGKKTPMRCIIIIVKNHRVKIMEVTCMCFLAGRGTLQTWA